MTNTNDKRSCGDCSACCVVMGVEELKKDKYKRCTHLCAKGCGIYETRPQTCKAFECLWLQGMLTSEHRPDKLGIMFTATGEHGGLGNCIVAMSVWSGALENPKAIELLKAIAQYEIVIVVNGSRRQIMGPPDRLHDVEIVLKERGIMAHEGQYMSGKRRELKPEIPMEEIKRLAPGKTFKR